MSHVSEDERSSDYSIDDSGSDDPSGIWALDFSKVQQ